MSRTRKGSKGPGWEPWSNRHDKAEQKAAYVDGPEDPIEEICPGCPRCECRKCGGWIATKIDPIEFKCIDCGEPGPQEEEAT